MHQKQSTNLYCSKDGHRHSYRSTILGNVRYTVHFSLFLVPAQSLNVLSDTSYVIALSLKSSDGRGGIDSNDIRSLTKQNMYVLTSINELEHHVNHGIHILSIILGNKASLFRKVCISNNISKSIKPLTVTCFEKTTFLQPRFSTSLM